MRLNSGVRQKVKALPLEHKGRIQQLYMRLRDLAHEIRSVDSTLNLMRAIFWIALLVLVVWAVRLFTGEELPDVLGGVGLIATPAAWLYLKEVRDKARALFREQQEIKRELETYGACVSDTFGSIRVYAGSFSDECLIDPLDDSTYGDPA